MSLTDNAIAALMTADDARVLIQLHYTDCHPDKTQPRKHFSEASIRELAETMESEGQLQPILVVEDEEGYLIRVGERRWRAAHFTKTGMLDALEVSKQTAERILVAQIVENIHREAMHPLDEARAYRRLIDMKACKNAAEVARRVKKSEASISQALKLLTVPDPIQQLVADGIAKTDAALDLNVIAQHDPAAAAELVADAKQQGLLERKKTREVKQELEAKAGNTDKAGERKDAKSAKAPPPPATKPAVGKGQIVSARGNRVRVKVGIRQGSKQASAFRVALRDAGIALLVADGVHSEDGMAWVEFGEERIAFPTEDLVIVSVFIEPKA